jgi:hypothetical protein
MGERMKHAPAHTLKTRWFWSLHGGALFRRLAAPAEALDLDRLDKALLRLGLIPPAKTGRAIAERIAGARRLLHWQGLMLALQAVLILGGAGFAVLRGQGAG